MVQEIFIELSKVLILTVIVSGIVRLLKQPLIIGYIITGVIAGPVVLNLVQSTETFATFSQIGIAFLLFMVGLNLNPQIIKDVGKTSLITGLGQVLFTSTLGFGIVKMLGFSTIAAVYIAVAISFSSTIIIMKLLSDKRDLETLYGRISIGFLIIQDLIAIFILMTLPSIQNGANVGLLIFESLLKGAGLIISLLIISLYFLPSVTRFVAKSQELLLIFSVGWCFSIIFLFHYLDLSVESGALLAGITLSMSPYHYEISARMKPLRDFFLILFFVLLGSQMIFTNISTYILPSIVLSLFVLIGNPLIVMVLMGILGYTRRSSFLAGLTVAQISEFSLILIGMGVNLGHFSNEILSLLTVVGLVTIACSTYLILYSHQIYEFLSPYLRIFERKGKKVDEHRKQTDERYDVVLFGYNRIGFDILESFKKIGRKFMVIDYDPEVIGKLAKEGIHCKYGDANDYELLNDLNFAKVKMIISTIPTIDTNLLLINKVKQDKAKTIIAVVAHQIDDALRLYEQGATYVVMPHFLGGRHVSTMIEQNQLSVNKFIRERMRHIKHLKKRKELGHEHPRHL